MPKAKTTVVKNTTPVKKEWTSPKLEKISPPKSLAGLVEFTDLEVALSAVGKRDEDVVSFTSAEAGVVLVVKPGITFELRRGQIDAERYRMRVTSSVKG